ncbi:MAG: CoA-binding protein [Candidatus Aenigmarchaeota archaeon]|nr:CoA-binding protein [Candidatus Aenigmarchaeota archaeon]
MSGKSINKFFAPKSVAIVGASENPKKFGHVILKNYMDMGFSGKIYPVNPKADSILGIKCYKSVLDVREDIDSAVIVVPPQAANEALKECVKKRIDAVVMITAGYRETGGAGVAREQELKSIIKDTNTRVVGPNCIGIYDSFGRIDTLFLPDYKLKRPRAGDIAFISQSGAFALSILDWAATEEIGISRFVSYGNRADVDEIELLNYLLDDKKTRAIAVYLEGVRNGRDFLECLKKVACRKPVVILKAGKSAAGTRAVQSHTGSLAGSYDVFRGAIRQGGAVEAENTEQLFDFCRVLAYQPAAKGKRIAVVTNGGGFGVMCADSIERCGLSLAEFSKDTVEGVKSVMPREYSSVHNPLDLIGDADVRRFEVAIDKVIKDKNVDGIIIVTLLQTASLGPEIVDVIASANERSRKPIVVSASGGEYTQLLLRSLEKDGIPAYPSPDRAVSAMKTLIEYSER